MAYVYQHIRLDTFEPFYVGISNDSTYLRAKTTGGRNPIWKRIIKKTKHKVEIIIDNVSFEEAKLYETFYIRLYGRKDKSEEGTLCNLTDGGDGTLGNILTEEHKEKIRQSKYGNLHGKGVIRSPECIEKIRQSNLGRKTSEETKLKQSLAKIGKPSPRKGAKWTEETRERYKISISKAVKPEFHNNIKTPISQFDLNGNFIRHFISIQEAKKLGFGGGNISHCIKGNRKKHKGFIWKLKEN